MSSTSPAVGRALDVLLYLAGRSGPVSGAAIMRDLGMPRSSAYHLLEVLTERGFVVHLPDQRTYGLGVSAFEVGSAYLRHGPLEMWARPVLKQLVAQVHETAHLGILHGAETLYLLREHPTAAHMAVTLTGIGVRMPAHLTASGRAMLAHLPAAQVRALFPSHPRVRQQNGRRPHLSAGVAAGVADRAAPGLGRRGRPHHSGTAVGGGMRLRPHRPSGCGVQRDAAPTGIPRARNGIGARGPDGGPAVDVGAVRPTAGGVARGSAFVTLLQQATVAATASSTSALPPAGPEPRREPAGRGSPPSVPRGSPCCPR